MFYTHLSLSAKKKAVQWLKSKRRAEQPVLDEKLITTYMIQDELGLDTSMMFTRQGDFINLLSDATLAEKAAHVETYFKRTTHERTYTISRFPYRQLVMNAHDCGVHLYMPSDYVYKKVREILTCIAAGQDDAHELAESCVDIYTYDLLQWATEFYEFVDEARREYGDTYDMTFIERVKQGQYYHLYCIAESVITALEKI